MTKPPHSPLPWHFEKGRHNTREHDDHCGSIVNDQDYIIAAVNHDLGSKLTGIENAKLIVQSVNRSALFEEMLKALKMKHKAGHGFKSECKNCSLADLIRRAEEASHE